MSLVNAKIIFQYQFKYQLTFLVLINKYGEDNEILSEIELPITLSITHNLTHSEKDNFNNQWTLENRIQSIGKRESGWNFQRINTMGRSFYISGELNSSSYVKRPLRSNALVNIKNDDKYCFNWSILANLYPCIINPNKFANYKHYFDGLNIQAFVFTNGIKCSDMHKIERINNFSISIYGLNFCKKDNKWKHKLIPIEISKTDTVDRNIGLAIYINHFALIKKLKVFIGKKDIKNVSRRCLNSYTSENMIIKHQQQCIQKQITSIRTSSESHLDRMNHFHRNLLSFRIYAVFEADNERRR